MTALPHMCSFSILRICRYPCLPFTYFKWRPYKCTQLRDKERYFKTNADVIGKRAHYMYLRGSKTLVLREDIIRRNTQEKPVPG